MDKSLTKLGPIRIGLMLIDGFALMSYSAVVEPLRAANLLAERPLYHIRHIAEFGSRATSSVSYTHLTLPTILLV